MNPHMNPNFKNYLLKTTNSSACKEIEVIQSLWSDYGKISRYQLVDSSLDRVVIKHISLNQSSVHPRGWNTNNSHKRKVKSYEIETHWYEKWSQNCSTSCRIPKFIGSFSEGHDQWIILEDLNTKFQAVSQEMYAQQGAEGAAPEGDAPTDAPVDENADAEDVDFEEVK